MTLSENLSLGTGWVESAVVAPSAMQVLAIDCEMSEVTDPVTGAKESALVRLSIVDGLHPDRVIADTLVKPDLPITDTRQHIHGISADALAHVSFNLRHAQALLLNICGSGTIMIGHGLNNDLKALKFVHTNVVDTALVYKLEVREGDEPSSGLPAIRDITEQCLGFKMPDTHDSVVDARAALQASTFAISSGLDTIPAINKAVSASASALLVHRIPHSVSAHDILQMVLAFSHVLPLKGVPMSVSAPGGEPSGKVNVVFASPEHARLAFEAIPGPVRLDKVKKAQKRVYLKGGGYVSVRR
jgi:RNA exonuclease 1